MRLEVKQCCCLRCGELSGHPVYVQGAKKIPRGLRPCGHTVPDVHAAPDRPQSVVGRLRPGERQRQGKWLMGLLCALLCMVPVTHAHG